MRYLNEEDAAAEAEPALITVAPEEVQSSAEETPEQTASAETQNGTDETPAPKKKKSAPKFHLPAEEDPAGTEKENDPDDGETWGIQPDLGF